MHAHIYVQMLFTGWSLRLIYGVLNKEGETNESNDCTLYQVFYWERTETAKTENALFSVQKGTHYICVCISLSFDEVKQRAR